MDPAVTSHVYHCRFRRERAHDGHPEQRESELVRDHEVHIQGLQKGVFRWRCIVPCGFGLYGNGGPMQALGYMDGLITVT
jgi:hypothetical protein